MLATATQEQDTQLDQPDQPDRQPRRRRASVRSGSGLRTALALVQVRGALLYQPGGGNLRK